MGIYPDLFEKIGEHGTPLQWPGDGLVPIGEACPGKRITASPHCLAPILPSDRLLI
jgi:hypothetical protein